MITVYGYKKCSTCTKAKKFLTEKGADVNFIDMVESTPSHEELAEIIGRSDYPIDDFFNKRGKKFKEHELGDKLPGMSDDEKIKVLSTDGMLIKRPFVVSDDAVILGFKEDAYEESFNL